MKITIVIDTEDIQGLEDARQIANLLVEKHGRSRYASPDRSIFGKIALIKLIREYGRWCEEYGAECVTKGEEPRFSGLKECKQFIDARWKGFDKYRL